MTNKPTAFSLQDINPSTLPPILDSLQIASDYAVARGLRFEGNPFVSGGKPLLLKEARVGIVSSGEAIVEIDLTEYHVTKGMIVLVPNDTIICIRSATSDYALNGTILLPTIGVDEAIIIHPEDDKHQDTMRVYETLYAFCQNHLDRKNVIEHLQCALVNNIRAIRTDTMPQKSPTPPGSRGEEIFQRFKVLVSRNAQTERKVTFYADLLCVSPHYLMSVIQRISGQSVMMWVEHAAMLQAKIMLSTMNAPLSSIAEEMNFPSTTAFCRWFRRIEGKTPGEYAKKQDKMSTHNNNI